MPANVLDNDVVLATPIDLIYGLASHFSSVYEQSSNDSGINVFETIATNFPEIKALFLNKNSATDIDNV
ncbi:hypothetical protein Trydic_g21830, partial [Trypoxylus dichotomus]